MGGSRPLWTLVEAGWGCAGLTEAQLAAFWWRYARDGKALQVLTPLLHQEAARIAREQQWPKLCDGYPYLPELVEHVLAEETMSDVQRHKVLERLAAVWGTSWEKHLSRRHRAIGAILDRWCVGAHDHIARRIREYDDD